jgi:hypothetical protein
MSKQEKKKIFLGAVGLIALIYVYFTFFIGPLNKSRGAVENKIAEVENKIAASKSELSKAARLEENARGAINRNTAIRALIPEGAPIAWFPPRMRTFFANQQIDKATARLEATAPVAEKELENWMRYVWVIDLPQTDFALLGHAIAALENSEPLLAITKLRIHAGGDEPELQQVTFTASTLIEKK